MWNVEFRPVDLKVGESLNGLAQLGIYGGRSPSPCYRRLYPDLENRFPEEVWVRYGDFASRSFSPMRR